MVGRLKALTILLVLVSFAGFGQENIWRDGGFEVSGNTSDCHSGSKALMHEMGEPEYHKVCRSSRLSVEPFAVYRATAFVKGTVPSGQASAFNFYGWFSFGWWFMASAPIKTSDKWTQVSVDFCVPAQFVDMSPLVLSNAKNAKVFMDDLSIVRIKSAEENLAELKAKAKPDASERMLLARHYLASKDFDSMRKLLDGALNSAKADILFLLAKNGTDKAQRGADIASMIAAEVLRWPDGRKRLKELFNGMSSVEQTIICLNAIALNPGSEKVNESLSCVEAVTFDSMTVAQEARLVEHMRKTIEDARKKLPAGEKHLTELLEKSNARLAAHQANLGHSRITLSGKVLTPDNYVIVLPENPTPSEGHAAKELAMHLELVTGMALDIVTEDAVGKRTPVIIGRGGLLSRHSIAVDYAKLGLEGICIENRGGVLALAGGQRGVLYAVYTFLEDYIGCRWFTPDCTYMPKDITLNLPDFRKEFVPALELRYTDYPSSRPAVFGVRNKFNGFYVESSPKWGGTIQYRGFVHTFNSLVNPAIYGTTHPEYYSEINGKRVTEQSQLCLTNPDVLRIATEKVRKWIQESPDATIFSVSQNDWHNYCTCDKCNALAEKEGSQAGPLLHFVNAIARGIAKEYPGKIIDTLAYQYTRKPPLHVRPEPNVAVRLCSIECCFIHELDKCPANKSFVEDMVGWSKICKRLHIWDYVINYSHCIMPFPNLDVLKPNIQFFIRHGATGIYEEANYFSKGGELAELRSYLIAKYLWNPDYDSRKALVEFTDAYYGPAAPFIRDYLANMHKAVCSRQDIHVRIFSPPSLYLNDRKLLDGSLDILGKALKAVANDDLLTHRVKLAMLPVIYTKVTLGGSFYRKDGNTLVTDSMDSSELMKLFRETVEREGITRYREASIPIQKWIDSNTVPASKLPIEIISNDKLRLEILPAMGGRIWRATALPSGKALLNVFEKNGDYSPDEGGYEEYADTSYRLTAYNEPFTVIHRTPTSVFMKAKLKNGLEMTRHVEILPNRCAFKVSTSINNPTQATEISMRNHPEFLVSSTGNCVLKVKGADGTWQTYQLGPAKGSTRPDREIYLKNGNKPAGEWAVVDNATGITVTNTFSPEDVDFSYTCALAAQKIVTMEHWTKTRKLSPGIPLSFTNIYEITVKK